MRKSFLLVVLPLGLITMANVVCSIVLCRQSIHQEVAASLHDSLGSALTVFEQCLNAQDWQHADDALMAAMRLAPEDTRVFDAALKFVRTAGKTGDDDALSLSQDIYQRIP